MHRMSAIADAESFPMREYSYALAGRGNSVGQGNHMGQWPPILTDILQAGCAAQVVLGRVFRQAKPAGTHTSQRQESPVVVVIW